MADINVNRINQANIYLDGTGLLGQVEEVNLPEVKYMDSEHKVLGLIGSPEFFAGLDKMEMKLKLNSLYSDVLAKMADPFKVYPLQLRGHLMNYDITGNTGNQKVVAFLRVRASGIPGYGFKPKDNVESELTMKVLAYKLQIGDREIFDIDIMSNVLKVDGVDLLAEYRANIGG